MKTLTALCMIVLALSIVRAEDVVVQLSNGSTIEGKLLSVRDSAIVLDRGGTYKMWDKDRKERGIVVVLFRDIRLVKVEGRSYLVEGAAIGLACGYLLGAAAHSPPSTLHGVAGVFPGLLVGFTVGAIISPADAVIGETSPDGFGALRKFATYPEQEPDWLQEIH